MATQAQQSQLLAFLVGAFDAAPTAEIFAELTAAIDAGVSVDGLSDIIVGSDVFKGLYADDAAFVANFPTALVGDFVSAEVLADAEGVVAQWINEDGMSIAAVISNALIALAGVDSADETWGAAKVALENKVTVAQYYVDNVSGATLDLATLQGVLAGVTQDAATVTTAQASIDATANAGGTFTLTTGTDNLFGTAGNDTFTATVAANGSTLTEGDVIADSSTADDDTLTINSSVATVDTGLATIVGIENTVVNFSTFGTAVVDAEGVKGGELTVNQNQAGSNGNATVNGKVGSINIVAGEGVTGTLTVDKITAGSTVNVDAGTAATVTTTTAGAKGSMAVVGGEKLATVSTVAATADVTTTAASATVNLDGVTTTGTTGDVATVSFGKAASIVNGAVDAVETLTVSSSFEATSTETATATISTAAATTYTIAGANDVTLAGNESMFDGKTVTDSSEGTSTLKLTTVDTSDLSKAAVDVIEVAAAAAGAATLSVNDGATVKLSSDVNAGGLVLSGDDDVATTATTYMSGTLNIDLAADDIDGGALTVTNAAASTDGFTAVNLTVSKDQDDTGLNLLAGTATVTATGSEDLKLQATATAKSLDASAMTGAVTVVFDNTNDIATVTTGAGADTITNSGAAIAEATKAVINTGAGNDNITMFTGAYATIDGGDGYDKVTVVGDMSKLVLSNVEEIATSGNVTSALASQFSGKSYIVSGANTFTFGTAASLFDTDTIDLSSLQVNGITGFTVDLTNGLSTAKFVSTTGATVTGSSVADTITGTANADTISGGAGNDILVGGAGNDIITGGEGQDTITGGAGADTIDLTETTAATDKVVYLASTDGAASGVDGIVSGYDVITGFVSANDVISIDGALETAIDKAVGAIVVTTLAASAATDIDTETAEAVLVTKAVNAAAGTNGDKAVTAADLNNTTKVAALLEAAVGTVTDAAGVATATQTLFAVESSDDEGEVALYVWTQSSATDVTIGATELSLLGVVSADSFAATDIALL